MTEVDKKLINELKNNVPKLINLMNNQNLNEYIKIVVSYSFEANKYFNDLEPWTVKKKDPERMNEIIYTICEQIRNISILLSPIIPLASNKVLENMNVKNENISIEKINNLECFNHDIELKNTDILFNKIENDN